MLPVWQFAFCMMVMAVLQYLSDKDIFSQTAIIIDLCTVLIGFLYWLGGQLYEKLYDILQELKSMNRKLEK